MSAKTIILTDEMDLWIENKVATGAYASPSDLVHDALDLLERRDREAANSVESLRQAWRNGIVSGDAGDLDFAELKQEARRRLAGNA